MDKKYFETKPGSLEDVSTKIAKEQPTIKKPEPNVKLETKSYFDVKPGSLADAAAKVVSESLDPVNKVAVKKDFADRKDKDIDNDGDTDSTDKYLHKRRQAISKAVKSEAVTPDDKGEKQNQTKHQLAKKGEKEIIKPISEKKVECPQCKGKGCEHCDNKGYHIAEKVDNPYAVGMAQAMKSTGDKPPLEKSTIKKAHDIAKAVKKEFAQLRTETKEIQLGDKGKTLTGKKAPKIDVEPRANPI